MKLRVRFGELRFIVDIKEENATLLTLKKAVGEAASLSDIATLEISLNGKDVIGDDDLSLSSHGLVNGDLIYVLTSASRAQVRSGTTVYNTTTGGSECGTFAADKVLLSRLVEMGFGEGIAEHALVQVNNTSVDAALEFMASYKPKEDMSYHVSGKAERGSIPAGVENDHLSSSSAGPSRRRSGNSDAVQKQKESWACNVMNLASPAFCRDGVSLMLQSLYDKAGVKTQHEAVFIIIHALMLECGFQSQSIDGVPGDRNKANDVMPVGWNDKNVFNFQYLHNLCPSISCDLVVASLGPFVYAHAWSCKVKCDSYQVKLVVSQFVRGDVSLSSGASSVYVKLHKASRLVKDHLVHPLLAAIRWYLGITTPFSLLGLPPEVQLVVLSQLDVISVVRLTITCKNLYSICNDEKLWKFFCKRDFEVEGTSFSSWKQQYKTLYREKQVHIHELYTDEFTFPQRASGIPVFNPFLPRFPPGFLGGPYDIFPDAINVPPRDERLLPLPLPGNSRLASRPTSGHFLTTRPF